MKDIVCHLRETTYKDVAEALIEELRHRTNKESEDNEDQDMVTIQITDYCFYTEKIFYPPHNINKKNKQYHIYIFYTKIVV